MDLWSFGIFGYPRQAQKTIATAAKAYLPTLLVLSQRVLSFLIIPDSCMDILGNSRRMKQEVGYRARRWKQELLEASTHGNKHFCDDFQSANVVPLPPTQTYTIHRHPLIAPINRSSKASLLAPKLSRQMLFFDLL